MVPLPPTELAIDPILQRWVTSVVGGIAAFTVLFGIVQWRRTGSPIVLMLVVAGGACMLLEPIVDVGGGCWHPAINQWTVFTAFGRPMPLWLCLCYFAYFGLGSGLMAASMQARATRASLWWMFVAGMAADMVLEVTLLNLDAYVYYGYQPLVIWKFPLWAAPVNSMIALSAAAASFVAVPVLKGWRILAVVPMTLSVSAAINSAVGWPAWIVIHTELPWVVTQLGGIATFAFAGWFMTGLTRVVLRGTEPVSLSKN